MKWELSTEIREYDIIMIGHQRANVYFGDDPNHPPRGKPVTCTSTLIRGKEKDGTPFALLIDPTTRNSPEEYYFELQRRTGLAPERITHCFCTHEHFDHLEGFSYFPAAISLPPKLFPNRYCFPQKRRNAIKIRQLITVEKSRIYPEYR